jgi:hypothetical protein
MVPSISKYHVGFIPKDSKSIYCIHASINSVHGLINLEDKGNMML